MPSVKGEKWGARRAAGLLLLASVPWLSGPLASAEKPAAGSASPRPNIVLFVADDVGWTALSAYGSDRHATPHLDALAKRGVKFTQAYAAAPVCTPTRASILAGRHPARLNMTIWHEAAGKPPEWQRKKLVPPVTKKNLPLDAVTLAEVLKRAGYFTAHVGKWHLGDASHYPLTQGFEINIGGTHWGAPPTYFFPYRGPFGGGDELRYVPDLPYGKEGDYLTDHLTERAIETIERAADEPFFLHMAYHTVHLPLEGKPALVERHMTSHPDASKKQAEYAAMHASLDRSVGRILEKLSSVGVADRTLVVFVSDNGASLKVTTNDPLRSGKGSLYEGGIRVPLLVDGPGVADGAVCDEPVITTDLYPTLLSLADVPADSSHDPTMDGSSLVPLLQDPTAALDRKALYWHYPHYYPTTSPVSAIRKGHWKLLEYHEDDRIELYNLAADPGESEDLSDKREDKARDLRRMLHDWRSRVGAPMPRPNPKR